MNVLIGIILIIAVILSAKRICRAIWSYFLISETLEAYGIEIKRKHKDE